MNLFFEETDTKWTSFDQFGNTLITHFKAGVMSYNWQGLVYPSVGLPGFRVGRIRVGFTFE